jgi:tetratricopeptide (TPR) repeat protein
MAGVLFLAMGITRAGVAEQLHPLSVREVDAPCAQCHYRIVQSYLDTPMANASGMALERLHPGAFLHKGSGIEFKITVHKGRAYLSSRNTVTAQPPVEHELKYFLGSGHLGTTYLYSIGEYLFESPIAWYAPSRRYDMKPGLEELRQIPPTLPMQSECMRCHMSSVQRPVAGTINRYPTMPFLHAGVTCEACHGPSRKHVNSNGKVSVISPVRLTADKRDSVCISCHLEGDISVERAGRSALDYRPGDSISEYIAYYVYGGENLTRRAVSEVEQLGLSTCKRVSGDRMSCMSCHDPHYTPDAQHRVAFYRGKCLACHRERGFAAVHHPENKDCTACHMRQSAARNVPHVAWTDHRILKLPENSIEEIFATGHGRLAPIFSPNATARDQAMADYRAVLEGDQSLEAVAWEELNRQRDAIDSDKDALNAVGILAAKRGESQVAEKAFRRVLELDPFNLIALSNFGILRAKAGKTEEALSLLRKAFNRSEDIPALAMNLARVQCIAGNATGARSTLKTAFTYSGELESMRTLLAQLNDCGGTVSR